jgi:hypothetical protein
VLFGKFPALPAFIPIISENAILDFEFYLPDSRGTSKRFKGGIMQFSLEVPNKETVKVNGFNFKLLFVRVFGFCVDEKKPVTCVGGLV